MNTAFLLTLLVGLLWSTTGAIVSMARNQACPVWSFYTCGSFLAVLALCVSGLFSPGELTGCGFSVILFLALGAILNSLGQALTMYNLRGGARALIFAIPQLYFVVVFVFSVLLLHEKATVPALVGLLLLCIAVIGTNLLGKKSSDSTLPNRRQLLICLASAVIIGLGRVALLLAGRAGNETISAGTKSVVLLLFSTLAYGAGMFSERGKVAVSGKMILKYGGAWAVFAALSYYVLFQAIEAMNRHGHGGLVFAIACATMILAFWCFSMIRMHDRFSWKQAVLMVLIILGVILLS